MQYEKEVLIDVSLGNLSFNVLTRIAEDGWEKYFVFELFEVWKRKLKK